jgi:hypothetical protein
MSAFRHAYKVVTWRDVAMVFSQNTSHYVREDGGYLSDFPEGCSRKKRTRVCKGHATIAWMPSIWPLLVGKTACVYCMRLALSTQNFVIFLLVMSNMFLGLKVGKASGYSTVLPRRYSCQSRGAVNCVSFLMRQPYRRVRHAQAQKHSACLHRLYYATSFALDLKFNFWKSWKSKENMWK